MLCQFTVKNFKSIRDEVTLDMQASSISEHTDKIIKLGGKDNLLPVAVIYGPNGGGKSNVLKALHALIARVELPILAIGLGKKVLPSLNCFLGLSWQNIVISWMLKEIISSMNA